ncbi:valine--tRNA ligase [soil metagenome]
MADASAAPPAPAASSTAYNPAEIEAKWYQFWEEGAFFEVSAQRVLSGERKPHVIAMPPPNVTGRLHMGHALQDTVQDIYTRLRRMQGFESLWIPGIDHAGIATQNVVERELKEQDGKTRHDLGREAFVEKVWDWKQEYGDIILQQKRRLGDSCDWRFERFTMDEGLTRAVQHVFVKLFEQDLIYRGDYLVNWDPENQTAISDEEVDNVERDGHLWFVKYPVDGMEGEFVTIATTRPETIPADSGLAVHPEDARYAHLLGKQVRVPTTDRLVPIIADDYIDPEFGSGALKVTPAHDKNDFEIGQRHGLEVINIMNPDGTLNEAAGKYDGVERFEARKQIVADLDVEGLLVKTEPLKGTVPISSRSKAVVEPLISRQWFVRMKPLADPALEAVRNGEVAFHPKRWENDYYRWLENIRDWTISRQLWWGHRIPVWYYTTEDGAIDESRDFVVAVDQPAPGMVQDEDVLDTWFSSWLWPFATLGWPEETDDMKAFYPGSVLVSGYDILFFWIARMIMAGVHFTGQVPFRDVFITGMIKDKQGRWMSKSLGNGIDPLDMIEQYGADAVRFTLAVLCAQGQDIKLDPAKFEGGRNFANKVWNAFNVFGRFIEKDENGRPARVYRRTRTFNELELVERWMMTRLAESTLSINDSMDRYRISEAAQTAYDVIWRDFCDWYLELIKPAPGEQMEEETLATAVEIFERLLQLVHPFMPFVTEELWSRLRPRGPQDACMTSAWPQPEDRDEEAAVAFALVQELVSGIRSVRSQYNVSPGKSIDVVISLADEAAVTAAEMSRAYIERLARVENLEIGRGLEKPAAAAAVVGSNFEVFVPLAGMIDLGAERARLEKEIAQKEGFLKGVEGKLKNEGFTSRAPADVVERERQKAADARAEIEKLRENLRAL